MASESPSPDIPGGSLEKTVDLLARVKAGDEAARNQLVLRFLPALKRWAHRRLPAWSRDLAETDDLVQTTLVRALAHVDRFEHRREGAFLAYLRQILLNAVRDEARRTTRRPERVSLSDPVQDPALVVQAVGPETLAAYEAALQSLPDVTREAIVLRVEFGYSFAEIAAAVGSPSSDAARMMVTRGLARLAEEMNDPA